MFPQRSRQNKLNMPLPPNHAPAKQVDPSCRCLQQAMEAAQIQYTRTLKRPHQTAQ